MLRLLAIVAMLALALPTLAMAEEEHHEGGPHPGAGGPPRPGPGPGGPPRPGPGGPPGSMGGPRPGGPPPGAMEHRAPPGTMGGPHPGGPVPGAMMGPHPGGPPPGSMGGPRPGGGPEFSFRGHSFHGVHADPYRYPPGFGYRRWDAGAVLPPFFLVPEYFYPEWAALGLEPPPPGTQWVRYGPDLLLVDVNTGQVIDTAYGVFY